jgi:Arc/MetJ-type ribon-helix-helix transcriptional regulator
MSKKTSEKTDHYSRVSWYSADYWLLNGFLLPELAHSALSDLIRAGRFEGLDAAIREGLRVIVEENAPLLVRTDTKWVRLLSQMNKAFKDARRAKPDVAGAENLRFLNEMYQAMDKAEKET